MLHFYGGVKFYLYHGTAGKINTHVKSLGKKADKSADEQQGKQREIYFSILKEINICFREESHHKLISLVLEVKISS